MIDLRILTPLILFAVSGCTPNQAVPKLQGVTQIRAHVPSVPQLAVDEIDAVSVPDSQLAQLSALVTPSEPCMQQIDKREHYLVAIVELFHSDGTKTTVYVRWTGHNPAAVSLDDEHFFYGGKPEAGDGAVKILQLLMQYHDGTQ